ncbi:TetR family transcriptional regulator [Citrobacter youngae]|nr:TetR family transcriptional regulator [Citrobacter youngae]
MVTTKCSRAPGRPRNFDPEQAVATVQRLFHAHGYDTVSVADVTQVLGIKPPVSTLLLGISSAFINEY